MVLIAKTRFFVRNGYISATPNLDMSDFCKPQQCLLCNPQMEHIEVPKNANVPQGKPKLKKRMSLGGIWITMNDTGEKRFFKPREICKICFDYHMAVLEERFLINRKIIPNYVEE